MEGRAGIALVKTRLEVSLTLTIAESQSFFDRRTNPQIRK